MKNKAFTPTLRAQVITRRTYNRPLNDDGTVFETWAGTVDRVIGHQKWLWERAAGRLLSDKELEELEELRALMLERKVSTSGRTLWLGGTEVAKLREASQFNCSFTNAETIYDVVDILWLLLQGCGVGFRPVVGQLTGFVAPIPNVTIIRSTRTIEEFKAGKRGREGNKETWNPKSGVWKISIGDSAEAWAKSIGKILAGKHPASELILDFSEIRPAGIRLKGYGWISSGDAAIAKAYEAIIGILNRRAGSLLTRMDIMDMVNWLGTVLSSRRSAEIALFAYGEAEWDVFSVAKREYWVCKSCGSHNTKQGVCLDCGAADTNDHRQQSNNSLLFRQKPTVAELEHIFGLMVAAGGSEPGFINEVSATKRAPWFKGCNPCVEILLGNKSFCNLFETDLGKFNGDSAGLTRAVELTARACYRQTCVNLKDGILQEAWHLNNAFLRLLGVGLTGVARRPDLSAYDYSQLQRVAIYGAYAMADALGLPRPKNVTTIKPSGTVSKIMDTTEGVHKPLGRYIFNNVNFGKYDPLVALCRSAGYRVMENPGDPEGVLITFPVKWDGVEFDNVDGKEVNLESAVTQLERYKMLQLNWCQQNVSCTVSYDPSEVPAIIEWLQENWDHYVGVSFLFRADPTKTAADLGYKYLPQEVVDKATWEGYANDLQPMVLDAANSFDEIVDECSLGGACPTR